MTKVIDKGIKKKAYLLYRNPVIKRAKEIHWSKNNTNKTVLYWPMKKMMGKYSMFLSHVVLLNILMCKYQNPREIVQLMYIPKTTTNAMQTPLASKLQTHAIYTIQGKATNSHRNTGVCNRRRYKQKIWNKHFELRLRNIKGSSMIK